MESDERRRKEANSPKCAGCASLTDTAYVPSGSAHAAGPALLLVLAVSKEKPRCAARSCVEIPFGITLRERIPCRPPSSQV